jgi:phosphate starvation-inducible PhoH-like protein
MEDTNQTKDLHNQYVEPGQPDRKLTKQPTSFKVQLTAEQKQAKAVALANQVTIYTGRAGTSKTLLSCNVALDLRQKQLVGKIIVTRPMIDVGKTMGFLPGEAFDFKEGKMAPYMAPILQAMYKLKGEEYVDNEIKKGNIVIVPIQFVRGLNFEDCVVLVDESQNLTSEELKALTTRLCKSSYMIFTSDVAQIDLYNKYQSAGHFFKAISKLPGVGTFELTENFRSPLALAIMDAIDAEKDKDQPVSDSSGSDNPHAIFE